MISESKRELQKEIPRSGKESKHGKEKTRKTLKTQEATPQQDLKTVYTMTFASECIH